MGEDLVIGGLWSRQGEKEEGWMEGKKPTTYGVFSTCNLQLMQNSSASVFANATFSQCRS